MGKDRFKINIFTQKKKKFLYEKYLENKRAEELAKREAQIRKDEIIETNTDITQVIGIASLDKSIGCTYISKAIYIYLKSMNQKVCIVSRDKDIEETTYDYVDICNLYDKFKYIIIDFGNLNKCDIEMRKEYRRSTIKIMLAKYENAYINKIGEWIKYDNHFVKKWTFIFNMINPRFIKKIDELMEDYKYYCLPLFYIDNIEENVKEVFKNIIFKGKGKIK